MIFKYAVKDFLARPLRDLHELKGWSDAKLARAIAKLAPQPQFVTTPKRHQLVAFYLLATCPRVLLLLAMGLGKTKIILDVIRWRKAAGLPSRILVLVPNVVNLEAWRDEVAIHAPDLAVSYLSGSRALRQRELEGAADLCVVTYAGLQALVCTRVPVRKSTKQKMVPDPKAIKKVCALFGGVVCDESTAVMSHTSLRYRVVKLLSKTWDFRVCMTGTPLGRNPQALWSQFYLADHGEALGATLGIFREAFFTERLLYWGGREYTFNVRRTKKLQDMMAHSSLRYAADECLDLPSRVCTVRHAVMSEEAWEYYSAVLEHVKDRHVTSTQDLENSFVRLRQITSGFVSLKGIPSPLTSNPKLDVLLELLEETGEDEKVVVFNEFIYSGDVISAALYERGIYHSRLYGKTRDKQGALRAFTRDPACRVLLVNSQSGAQGLNLQQSRYVVFYESPVSPIIRQQAEARCHRQGQMRSVFFFDLACRNTVDERILRFVREGRDLMSALVERGVGVLKTRESFRR